MNTKWYSVASIVCIFISIICIFLWFAIEISHLRELHTWYNGEARDVVCVYPVAYESVPDLHYYNNIKYIKDMNESAFKIVFNSGESVIAPKEYCTIEKEGK